MASEPNEGKKQQVTKMFNKIAYRYDMLNHLLSFNIDKLWRKKVIKQAKKYNPTAILDVATGTADLAIGLTKTNAQHINGIDISEEMLKIGEQKVKNKGLANIITLKQADAENIPFEDDKFDVVTVAFGVRNFENLEAGLSEMFRVMKPNGKVFVLEFTMPSKFPFKQLYKFYFNKILPLIGSLVSKDKEAYTYLPESVQAFPQNKQFVEIMTNVGFKNCTYKSLSIGVAAIYQAEK